MKRKNRYIGYILTFIIVQTISGCGSYAKNNQDITIFNSTDTTVLTRNNNSEILNYETNTIIETSETLLETPMYALYDYNITELCKALVNKNKEIINQYMFFNDGNIQFIDNINFESYKILSGKDSCLYEEYGRKDIFSEYLVSFYISSSNDARFPVGESKWKICFTSGLNAFCYYFIPEDSEINSLLYKKYEKNYDYKMENVAYAFTFIFGCCKDITKFSQLSDLYDETELQSKLEQFACATNEFKDDENEKNVTVTLFDTEFKILIKNNGAIGKMYESSLVYTINVVENNYIDITFYADGSYFTPAKRFMYKFNIDENNTLMLVSVSLIDDYGNEPVYIYYGDR